MNHPGRRGDVDPCRLPARARTQTHKRRLNHFEPEAPPNAIAIDVGFRCAKNASWQIISRRAKVPAALHLRSHQIDRHLVLVRFFPRVFDLLASFTCPVPQVHMHIAPLLEEKRDLGSIYTLIPNIRGQPHPDSASNWQLEICKAVHT